MTKLLPILVFLAVSSSAMAQRQAITGVSSLRIANYGAPSTVIKDRLTISDVVDELNGLRKKAWQRGETRLSCYSTLVLLRGEKRIGEFRIRPDGIVERPVEKGQSSQSLALAPGDLPRIARLLTEIGPMKDKDCQ